MKRPLSDLLHSSLVESNTEILGERIWKSFRTWCLSDLSPEAFDSLSASPDLLCSLVEMFGGYLFSEGHSIYLLRQLITYIQRTRPTFRGRLVSAWTLVSKWERLEPLKHRTPLPLVIYRAMISVAICWGWYRFAGIMVIAFEAICRPGEPLRAKRSDLLLCRDLVVESPSVVFLRIQNPKARHRGIGTLQHAKLDDLHSARFLDWVYGKLPRDSFLFAGSPASFRKRWDRVLSFLGVPNTFRLTPASLRSGGAVRAYRADMEISKILWKMRLKHMDTLQHYLQEVGAASIYAELPSRSREIVQQAALSFDVLMASF